MIAVKLDLMRHTPQRVPVVQEQIEYSNFYSLLLSPPIPGTAIAHSQHRGWIGTMERWVYVGGNDERVLNINIGYTSASARPNSTDPFGLSSSFVSSKPKPVKPDPTPASDERARQRSGRGRGGDLIWRVLESSLESRNLSKNTLHRTVECTANSNG